jgi:hypothetical protein
MTVHIGSSGLSNSETVSTGGLNKIIFPDAKTKNCVTIHNTLAQPKWILLTKKY